MKKTEQKIEVMAPAGSFEAFAAAINAGCDSVYFGVEQLNMRARAANNFSINDLPQLSKLAKKANVKAYLTMNTVLYQHDLTLMRKILDAAKAAKIDAAIIADVAAMQYAREINLPVHASTQLNISNYEAVKFFSAFADTIVLAREVDLKMMKKICDNIKEDQLKGPSDQLVKIEVFAHGALCIAQSGRCQMSIIQTNTSAQRGACLQECRKKYRLIDDETGRELLVDNQYVLSPKDLCTIDFLDKIIAAGVSVLKIEGRGRSADYVDTVVRCYREAVYAINQNNYSREKIADWQERLKTVYNRGFSEGYYLGKPLPEWSKSYGSQATEERIFAGIVNHYFPRPKIAEIKLQAQSLKKGDQISVIGSTTGVTRQQVTEIRIDEKSIEFAKHPAVVTLPFSEKIRKNDKVYIVRPRQTHQS